MRSSEIAQPNTRTRQTLTMRDVDALCIIGRLLSEADDLAWIPWWRRRRWSRVRADLARLWNRLGAAIVDKEERHIEVEVWSTGQIARTYRDYVAEIEAEPEDR